MKAMNNEWKVVTASEKHPQARISDNLTLAHLSMLHLPAHFTKPNADSRCGLQMFAEIWMWNNTQTRTDTAVLRSLQPLLGSLSSSLACQMKTATSILGSIFNLFIFFPQGMNFESSSWNCWNRSWKLHENMNMKNVHVHLPSWSRPRKQVSGK